MKISYFEDTDTLLVTMNNNIITETRDYNEDILLEFDQNGHLVALTIEHASLNANLPDFSYNQIRKNLQPADI